MRIRPLILVSASLWVCLAPPAARAQTPPKACSDAASQREMEECADRAFRKADQELNESYREIERRLVGDAAKRERLVAAQRAWIAFRDAECAFSTSAAAGGSAHPTAVAMCAETMTNHRLQDFKAYLKCEEGDMSCPVPAK